MKIEEFVDGELARKNKNYYKTICCKLVSDYGENECLVFKTNLYKGYGGAIVGNEQTICFERNGEQISSMKFHSLIHNFVEVFSSMNSYIENEKRFGNNFTKCDCDTPKIKNTFRPNPNNKMPDQVKIVTEGIDWRGAFGLSNKSCIVNEGLVKQGGVLKGTAGPKPDWNVKGLKPRKDGDL